MTHNLNRTELDARQPARRHWHSGGRQKDRSVTVAVAVAKAKAEVELGVDLVVGRAAWVRVVARWAVAERAVAERAVAERA